MLGKTAKTFTYPNINGYIVPINGKLCYAYANFTNILHFSRLKLLIVISATVSATIK